MKDFDFNFYTFAQYIEEGDKTEEGLITEWDAHLKKTVCDLLQTSFDKIHVLDENIDENINEFDGYGNSNMEKISNEMESLDVPSHEFSDRDHGGESDGFMHHVIIRGHKALCYWVSGFMIFFVAE